MSEQIEGKKCSIRGISRSGKCVDKLVLDRCCDGIQYAPLSVRQEKRYDH